MSIQVGFAGNNGYHCNGQKLATAHRGLLLDKYMGVKEGTKDNRLPQWRGLCEPGLSPGVYKLAFERWKNWTKTLAHGVRFTGRIRGRMALGLGIETAQEIGCRLHATYGTPIIPGSSLKGMLRAGLLQMPAYEKHVSTLFGTNDSAGRVIVFDAWWMPEGRTSGLAPDVITVHHQQYYSGNGAPADRESPIPNHFLTVTGSFYFTFQAPDGWEAFVRKAAQHFLAEHGIGAKRSSGYGRFESFGEG
jgi:CRISPR-associated protein Cmr6